MRFLAFVFALFIGVPSCVKAYERDPVAIGHWTGGAYFDDKSAQFTHCALLGSYVNGVVVYLVYSDGGFSVGFSEPSWGLKEGEQYDFELTIDNRWSKRVTGLVPMDGAIRADLGEDPQAISAFRFGNLLTLSASSGTFEFQLQGTSRAIGALYNCYATHRWKNQSNPFAGNTNNPFGSQATQAQTVGSPWRTPATLKLDELKNLLAAALGTDFVAVPAEKDSPADYFFGNGAVAGAYWEENAQSRSADQVFANAAALLQSDCQGTAASAITSRNSKNPYEERSGFIACRQADGSASYISMIILVSEGLADIFLVLPATSGATDSDRAAVEAASAKLDRTLARLISSSQ